jgi:hypothetical protein
MPFPAYRLLTMTRTGEFVVPRSLLPTDQCGPSDSNHFTYSVSLASDNLTPDDHGFLIDNAAIRYYFDNRYRDNGMWPHAGSCEDMAREAAEFFWELFNNPDPTIRENLAREYLTPLTITLRHSTLTRVSVRIASAGATVFDYELFS